MHTTFTIDIDTNGVALGYIRFMQKHKKHFDDVITFKEETCFYLFWLCKFLINSPSKRIITYYLPIAIALFNKHKLALVFFFLGSVYRSMFLFTTDPKDSIGGPLWFTQLWAYAYFPQLALKSNPSVLSRSTCYAHLFTLSAYEPDIFQILRIGLSYFLIRRELDLLLISFLLLRLNSLDLKCFF
jgi:hypothetical protein